MTQPKLALYGKASGNMEEEGRAYKHPHSKKNYPSVTTVLKMVSKDSLLQWVANTTIDWAVNNLDKLYGMSVEKGINIGKYRYKDYRNERAEVGDGVHATIESEHTGTWIYPELDDEQKRIMAQWRELKSQHRIEPIYTEVTVADEQAGYMGTLDGYWLIDGVKCLIDIKTSKSTWPEHEFQLAALWQAPKWLVETSDMVWDEIDRPPIEAVKIIHLREDKWEIIDVEDLELNYECFASYLKVWYARASLTETRKKRNTTKGGF